MNLQDALSRTSAGLRGAVADQIEPETLAKLEALKGVLDAS